MFNLYVMLSDVVEANKINHRTSHRTGRKKQKGITSLLDPIHHFECASAGSLTSSQELCDKSNKIR